MKTNLILLAAVAAPLADPSGISFNTMINSIALGVVAAITAYQTWRAARDAKVLAAIQKSTAETHSLINRPFGLLLDSLASELEDRARKSKIDADILRAVEARRRSDEHAAAQKEVDDATKAIATNRDKIIADFKAGDPGTSVIDAAAKLKVESYVAPPAPPSAPVDTDPPLTEKRVLEIIKSWDRKK